MLNILAFFKALGLLIRAIKASWFSIAIAIIIIFIIYKYVNITWLKWILIIFTSGGFFYSIYDDVSLFVHNETTKALINLDRLKKDIKDNKKDPKDDYGGLVIKEPTLKDGLINWAKAIFMGLLLYLLIKYT